MKRIEKQATIAATPEAVFDYLADLGNLAEWQPSVESVERTADGPIGAGSRAQVVQNVMGRRITAPLVITEYERPHRLGIESKVSGIEARVLLALRAADEKTDAAATDLDFAMEIRGSGFSSFLESMVANGAAAEVDASLQRIRERFRRSA